MDQAREQKICLFPFRKISFGPKKFIPCCPSWVSPEFLAVEPDVLESDDMWNSPIAQKFREKMYNGDFSWCQQQYCKTPLVSLAELQKNAALRRREGISDANLEAMLEGRTALPEGPTVAVVLADNRCNLKCRQCRSEHIFTLSDENKAVIDRADRLLERNRESLVKLHLSTDGEVFFSPWLRNLLKSVSRERFPVLESIQITSNGLLFDERAYEALKPGTSYIKNVSISIDAGTKEVYQVVRGGDWEKLMANLEWLSSLRKSGQINILTLSFVVGLRNFMTIPEFVDLGERLGADHISFARLRPMGDVKESSTEFVYHPKHPLYPQLSEICRSIESRPGVQIFFPYCQLPQIHSMSPHLHGSD